MKPVVLAALCGIVLPMAVHAQSAEEKALAQETYVEGIRILSNPALEKAGVRLAYVLQDTQPGGGKYFCGALTGSNLQLASSLVATAFAKMPAASLQQSGLKTVLLCSEAKDGGRAIGGIPVPPINLLMLGAGNGTPSNRFGTTALHEFYHFVEFKKGLYNDSAWDAAFPGYSNSYGATSPSTALGSAGGSYLNGYSKTFAPEERAEIFAHFYNERSALDSYLGKGANQTFVKKLTQVIIKCRQMLGQSACQ